MKSSAPARPEPTSHTQLIQVLQHDHSQPASIEMVWWSCLFCLQGSKSGCTLRHATGLARLQATKAVPQACDDSDTHLCHLPLTCLSTCLSTSGSNSKCTPACHEEPAMQEQATQHMHMRTAWSAMRCTRSAHEVTT